MTLRTEHPADGSHFASDDLWSSWWRGLNQDLVWLKVVRELERHMQVLVGADTLALWARLPPRGEWLRVAWKLRDRPVVLPPDVEPHASLELHLAPQRYVTANLDGPYRRLLDRAGVAGGWLLPLISPQPTARERQWVGVLGVGWRGEPPKTPPSLLGLEPVVWYLLGQRLEDMYTRAVLDTAALAGPPTRAEDWQPLMASLSLWLGGDHWALFRTREEGAGSEVIGLVAEGGSLGNRGADFVTFLRERPELFSNSALFRAMRQRRLVVIDDLREHSIGRLEVRPTSTTDTASSLLATPLGTHPHSGFGILVVYWTKPRGWNQFGLSLQPWEALRRLTADWWQDMHTALDATHDSLTGARNRHGIALAWRNTLACMDSGLVGILDVDNFHEVNNNWGHLMGDDVLRVLSHVLEDLARQYSGWWGRWGGDEFVLVLPADVNWHEVGQQLQTAVDDHTRARAWPQPITVSGGATLWRRSRCNWETVLARADRQLHHAKEQGRARFLSR